MRTPICMTCALYMDWRADEDDRPAALTIELGRDGPHEMYWPQHVDVERRVPILVGRGGHAAEDGVERRDLHETVHRTEALNRARHERRGIDRRR